MANLFFGVVTNAGTVTHDTPTISTADIDRFADYVWAHYPQLNPDGTPKPKTNANLADAFRNWAEALWSGTQANILRHEKVAAAKAASDGVGDWGV